MPTIQVREGQCLLDIAMQECGDATAAFAMAVLNRMSVTDDLEVNQVLQVAPVVNDKIRQVFIPEFLKPASVFDNDIFSFAGIGYWYVGQDFKVS